MLLPVVTLQGKSRGGVGPKIQHHGAIWEQPKTDETYFRELFRVSRNQIIWGGNYFTKAIQRDSQGWIVWDKCHPAGTRFADAELAWTSFNVKTRIFRFLWNGMCQGTPGNGTKMQGDKTLNEKRIHPTQSLLLFTPGSLPIMQNRGTRFWTRTWEAVRAELPPMTRVWILSDAKSTRNILTCRNSGSRPMPHRKESRDFDG